MTIIVSGFAPDDAVPDAYINSVFGAGLVSVSSLPVKVACLGNKTSDGSATADQDIIPITSESDADTYLGASSECGEACRAALSVNSGASIYAVPVADPTGTPVAANITITFTIPVAIQRNGTLRFRVGALPFAVGVSTSDSVATIVANTLAAANSVVHRRYLGTATSPAVTLTMVNTGARGNQTLLWFDASDVPGLTVTIAGGTAVHSNLVPFHNGTGADSLVNVLALLKGDVYDYLACSQNDATNIGLVKAQLATEAVAGVSHLEHALFGIFGAYSDAQSLSTTTMNDARCTLLWSSYLENTPAWYVGFAASRRAGIVAQQPNFKWAKADECKFIGAQAHAYKGDNPNHAVQKNALNNGLCVIASSGSDVAMVRAIVSKCLSSSNPDFRTRDWADVDTTDAVNKRVRALWNAVASVNQYAVPDDSTKKAANSGEITPSSWNAQLLQLMKELEANNWVYLVDTYQPQSEWDSGRKCIMSAIPVYVKPKTFQFGANVNQSSAA